MRRASLRWALPLALPLAFALALLGAPSVARAGPWTPEPGHGYAKFWLKYLYGFYFFDGSGEPQEYGAYQEIFLNTYGEVGLAEGLALTYHWPMLTSFVLEDTRRSEHRVHFAPGDPTLGLRFRFLAYQRFVAAVEAGVRAPFARSGPIQPVYGTAEGHPEVGQLRIGTGVWDFPASVSAGYSWDRFYVAGSFGYVLRTDGYQHVLTWSAEGGWDFNGPMALRARVVGYHSLDGVVIGDPAPGHSSPSGIGNGTSYIGFAVEGDFEVEEDLFLGVSFEGGIGALVRQTGGPVITLYVATNF